MIQQTGFPGQARSVPVIAWRRAAFAMFAVGWGANHFTALLPIYRRALDLPDTALTAIFGVYLFGLAPGLLLGGPFSDRYGRRPVLLVSVGLSLAGSLTLIAGAPGAVGAAALYVGRLLTGMAAGGTFAAGSAWVKELSAGSAEGTGARRAAISLSAGFGAGPLAAGLLAQWAPASAILPYLAHLAITAVALALLPGAPETVTPSANESVLARLRVPSAGAPRFRRVVAPMAPWVFGSATISFAVLPARAAGRLDELSVVFAGVVVAFTLATGILVQPLARRIGRDDPAHGATAGLGAIALGCAVGAVAAATGSPTLVLAAAVALGGGYGLCLVSGLREVERLAGPDDLAGLVAVYYVLAYCGFAAPYLLALLAPALGYPAGLLLAACLAVVTLLVVVVQARRPAPLTYTHGRKQGL